MRFRYTITGIFDIDPEHALRGYGTTNPREMTKVDLEQAYNLGAGMWLDSLGGGEPVIMIEVEEE